MAFLIGIVLGTTIGFILCGILTAGQISDLQGELHYLRIRNEKLEAELAHLKRQRDGTTVSA